MVRSNERRDRTGQHKRRTLLKTLGTAGAVGLGGLAGCTTTGDGGGDGGDGDGGDGGTTTGTTMGTTDTNLGSVTYGVLNPLTGPYSGLAEEQRKGAELAVRWINETHSDEFDVEVDATYKDTRADQTTAGQVAQQAIQQDGAEYLMGAISSSVAISLNAIAADQEVIYNPGGAAIPITGSQCNEYVFRFETNTAQIAEGAATWTLENLGSNVWFHIADYAYGDSVYREWTNRMEAADASFNEVGKTAAELGADNFDPFISEMSNSDADVVVVGATGGDLVKFLAQADSAGLKDEMAIMTTTGSFQVVRQGLGAAGYDVYSGVRYVPTIETGDNGAFVSAYRDEYGEAPDNFARVAFDSIRMTVRGMQAAGTTDPTELKDSLAGMEISPTIFGPNQFRSCDHQAMNPVWVGQNVAPDSGEVAAVDLKTQVAGEDAIPPCEDTGCSL